MNIMITYPRFSEGETYVDVSNKQEKLCVIGTLIYCLLKKIKLEKQSVSLLLKEISVILKIV